MTNSHCLELILILFGFVLSLHIHSVLRRHAAHCFPEVTSNAYEGRSKSIFFGYCCHGDTGGAKKKILAIPTSVSQVVF